MAKEIDFKKLQAPIPADLIKKLTRTSKKTGKSFTVEFVTARTVMNRLDEVCGPAGWRDEYRPVVIDGVAGVECTLYLLIGDEWVGKSDLGTPSDIEGAKGAYSVALKRAGAKWGIARELYRDGVADLDGEDEDEPEPVRAPRPKQQPAPKVAKPDDAAEPEWPADDARLLDHREEFKRYLMFVGAENEFEAYGIVQKIYGGHWNVVPQDEIWCEAVAKGEQYLAQKA